MNDCIFCKIAAGEIPSDKVYEDEKALAFRDINPQAPTHILVIPKKHVSDAAECAKSDPVLLGEMFLLAAKIAVEQGLDKNGFRLVSNCGKDAAQSVPHFHIHILAGRAMTEKMA